MALIVCPECGNNVSDKAEICIHCGFPLSEYIDEQAVQGEDVEIKQEFPKLPVLVAKFDKDYLITYNNGNIVISQDDNILYDGDIRNIEIHGIKKSIFNFGRMELVVVKSKVPTELNCKDDESFEICKQIVADYKLRTQEKREETARRIQEKQRIDNLIRQNRMCPHCHSLNIEPQCITYAAREDKTKTSYTRNINPLHPLTVLNKKEKVIRRGHPGGMKVVGYTCTDCGAEWKPDYFDM